LIEIEKDILFLCIEIIFGLTSGCKNLESIFCRLQVQHCDPSAQYKRSLGTYKRKRGLTLCYSYRRLGHLAKECPGAGPICLYCKVVGHEVEDYPKMIAKVEQMNMIQENKSMLENHKVKESEKYQTMLVQLKEVVDDHKL
jgi:hypothetical protein